MPTTTLTPLSSLRIARHFIPAYNSFPNTSIHPSRPLTIYHRCFLPSHAGAKEVEAHLREVGVVEPAWRYTMYTQQHYHSNTNEILVVVSDRRAELCFGGSDSEENGGKVVVEVGKGDVMIVPAGVGHALLRELDGKGRFEMVGSYPVGAEGWDMCTGQDGEKNERWKNVEKVGWFKRDPIYGDEGPVLDPTGGE